MLYIAYDNIEPLKAWMASVAQDFSYVPEEVTILGKHSSTRLLHYRKSDGGCFYWYPQHFFLSLNDCMEYCKTENQSIFAVK